MEEINLKYIYTGAEIKEMNKIYPWNNTIINSKELNDKLKYVLEIFDNGGMCGSITKAILYNDPYYVYKK